MEVPAIGAHSALGTRRTSPGRGRSRATRPAPGGRNRTSYSATGLGVPAEPDGQGGGAGGAGGALGVKARQDRTIDIGRPRNRGGRQPSGPEERVKMAGDRLQP